MPEGAAQQLDEIVILVAPKLVRIQRRKTPVLAKVGIRIWRRANRDAVDEQIAMRPGIGARARGADGEILIQTHLHSGAAAFGRNIADLSIELELKPFVKVNPLFV